MMNKKPVYNHVVTACGKACQEKYNKRWRNIIGRNRSTRRVNLNYLFTFFFRQPTGLSIYLLSS